MGYEIKYDNIKDCSSRKSNRAVLSWLFFGVFLLLVWGFWPEGREALARMLWSGDGEATMLAAETFVESLRCGLPFSDAAGLFCIQVLSGAGFAG